MSKGLWKRKSQPTTVLLRIVQTRTINQLQNIDCENGFHTGCPNVCYNQQQNRLSQDYTNRDDQPTTKHWLWEWLPYRLSERLSQPTTKQAFSGLHQPGRSTNYKHLYRFKCDKLNCSNKYWLLRLLPHRLSEGQSQWVTTINSPSRECTNRDNQPNTNIHYEDVFHTDCPNVSHNQQRRFLGLHHRQSIKYRSCWTYQGHVTIDFMRWNFSSSLKKNITIGSPKQFS